VKITIFVSYSHQDARYLEKNSLLGYLRGLENEDVEFWFDKKILVGEDWDSKIKSRISNAHIALVLVSQMFLDSSYCKDVEISGFLEERRTNGLIIFPIILSACEWQEHQWLRSEQFLPTGDETIEEHYVDPGRQKRLFHQIRQDLKAQIAIAREHHVARKPSDSSISDEGPSDTYPHGTVEAAETSNVTADAGQSQVPATKSTEANASEVTISSEQTKTMLPSSEDNLRKDLPKWVDRILSVRVEETGGFDGSLFEPSGSPSLWSTAQCLMGILGNGQNIVRQNPAAPQRLSQPPCVGQNGDLKKTLPTRALLADTILKRLTVLKEYAHGVQLEFVEESKEQAALAKIYSFKENKMRAKQTNPIKIMSDNTISSFLFLSCSNSFCSLGGRRLIIC